MFEGGHGEDMRLRLETLPPKKGIGWAPSTPPRKLPWPMTEPPAPCEAHVLAPTSSTRTCHRALLSPLFSLLMKPNKTSRPSLSLPPLPNPTTPHRNPNPPFQVIMIPALINATIHPLFRQCQISETTSSGLLPLLLLPIIIIIKIINNPSLTTMVLIMSSLLFPLTFLDTLAQI